MNLRRHNRSARISLPIFVGFIVAAVVIFIAAFISVIVALGHRVSSSTLSTNSSYTPVLIAMQRPVFPARPAALLDEGDVEVFPMTITGIGPGLPMQVRLYLPAGRHVPGSLPCVFIAPAGTRLIHGSALGDADSPEHLPYARAGFAVLAYELSGDLPNDNTHGSVSWSRLKSPVLQFMAADGGLANAKAAISFVLASVPEVDSARLYTAGHSSAATMALNVAASDHRMRAVAAYAPCCDVVARWADGVSIMERYAPGTTQLVSDVSPMLHVNDIACPILLFHADDDSNVKTSDNNAYVAALLAAGKQVSFQRVPSGGHYQSMIDQGIPAGIAFFIAHGANPLPPMEK